MPVSESTLIRPVDHVVPDPRGAVDVLDTDDVEDESNIVRGLD